MNNDIQQSELLFYLPITLSYGIACLIAWLGFRKIKIWNIKSNKKPNKPGLELLLAIISVVGVFGVGRIYSAGFLIPAIYNPWAWVLNNLIIYSPIFIYLIIRRQSLSTIWLSPKNLHIKLGIGIIGAIAATALFLVLRGEVNRWPDVFDRAFTFHNVTNFVAVFLENLAIAFLFIRLSWVANLKVALVIPGMLFALAHVPGMLADGDPWWHIMLMSICTGSIAVFVLYTSSKVKDIIWLGLVHYFLDVAINAF